MKSKEIVNSETEKQSKSSRNIIIAIVIFGMYCTFGMSWMGVVPLFQDIETVLRIDHAQWAWLISIVSLAKSIVPILAGILAARWGLTNCLRLSAILIVTGIIIPWLPSYMLWIAMRFLFGIGGAIWVTLMPAVTLQVFSPKARPLINALNGIALNAGVIVSIFFSLSWAKIAGWQMTLSFYSVLSGIFLFILWSLGDLSTQPAETSQHTPASYMDIFLRYLKTLKLPCTWLISLAFAGPLALYLVFNTWLPIYYQETFQIPKQQVMQWISWMNIWGIPAAIGTGFLLQIFKRCKFFILISAIILPIAAVTALNSTDPASMTVMLALTGVGLFLNVSPLITLLQNQPDMDASKIGMILGTMFSVTYILSSMAPGIVGWGYNSHISLKFLLTIWCIVSCSPIVAMLLHEKS